MECLRPRESGATLYMVTMLGGGATSAVIAHQMESYIQPGVPEAREQVNKEAQRADQAVDEAYATYSQANKVNAPNADALQLEISTAAGHNQAMIAQKTDMEMAKIGYESGAAAIGVVAALALTVAGRKIYYGLRDRRAKNTASS